MSRWLTDLATAARSSGLVVHEEPDWETRSNSTGGYVAGPLGVICHHTASSPSSDGQPDVDYMCYRSDIRPVAALYLSRRGEVWVMAAGGCNHAGKGGPVGAVPKDSANNRLLSIEAANRGDGSEAWPEVQQTAYITLVRALEQHYALDPTLCLAHWEWCEPSCPGRKIDPAGPARWGPSSWNMDYFRGDLAGAPGPEPTPPPTPVPGYPGEGDYGCTWDVCRTWQDMMIVGGWISDTRANQDGVWGNGMHGACLRMQQGFGWSDADGIGGPHSWEHACTRGRPPCALCGK
jgi:hypothetical protein